MNSHVLIGFDAADPERMTKLQWLDSSGVLGANLVAEGGSGNCQDLAEFFGQSYGAPEGTAPGPVVSGHLGTVIACGSEVGIVGGATDCTGAAQIPVSTTYRTYGDARDNEVRIARTFGFSASTGRFATTGLRPYVPRLRAQPFSQVLYPNQAGTAVSSVNVFDCGGDCFVAEGATWNARWFADVAPASGYAMIVLRDPSMTSPVDLTINNDGSSASNLASFVLLQPAAGWSEPVTEVEYLCFADLSTWPQADRDAARLPPGCGP